jgi:hypothetical protein
VNRASSSSGTAEPRARQKYTPFSATKYSRTAHTRPASYRAQSRRIPARPEIWTPVLSKAVKPALPSEVVTCSTSSSAVRPGLVGPRNTTTLRRWSAWSPNRAVSQGEFFRFGGRSSQSRGTWTA